MFALLATASCSLQEDKDIFDDSSANRIEEALQADKAILVGAANGWLMEFYPSAELKFGGYNILAHFDENGKATLSGEMQGSTKKVTSLYRLKQSAGPVLTFDSYNEIIHFFGEPLNGYDGDYEFTVMSAEPNKIVLSGTKSKAKIVMTPLADDLNWETYLSKVLETQAQAFLGTYNLVINGNVIGLMEQNYNTFSMTNESGSEFVPFMYTETGIKFKQPVTIGGVQMENFTLTDKENIVFTCTDEGVSAKLVGIFPAGYKTYNELEGKYKYGDRNVTITAKGDNKYTIKGMSTRADIEATYSRKAGSISIVYQYLGVIGNYQAYLCPCDDSTVTWQAGSGMDGVNHLDGDNFYITFKSNGVFKTANGFLVYAFSGAPSNATALGYLDQVENIKLVKQ